MKPCRLAGYFVSELVQFADLVKKRLELLLVDMRKATPSRKGGPTILMRRKKGEPSSTIGRAAVTAKDERH